MKHLIVAAAVVGLMAMASQGAIITQWTFETSVPTTAGPHAAEVGTGNAIGFHTTATTYSNPSGNGSLESFSSNGWLTVGDYYQFETSSAGYAGLTLTWDQTRSGTGPSAFDALWSTDGSTWNTLGSYVVPAVSWSSGAPADPPATTFTYALPAGADNQPNLYLRLSLTTAVAAAAGTNRIDNVTLTPEPMTLALLGLSGLAMGLRRRSR